MHRHSEAMTEVFIGLQQAQASLVRVPQSWKRDRALTRIAEAEQALNLLDEDLEEAEKESLTC